MKTIKREQTVQLRTYEYDTRVSDNVIIIDCYYRDAGIEHFVNAVRYHEKVNNDKQWLIIVERTFFTIDNYIGLSAEEVFQKNLVYEHNIPLELLIEMQALVLKALNKEIVRNMDFITLQY